MGQGVRLRLMRRVFVVDGVAIGIADGERAAGLADGIRGALIQQSRSGSGIRRVEAELQRRGATVNGEDGGWHECLEAGAGRKTVKFPALKFLGAGKGKTVGWEEITCPLSGGDPARVESGMDRRCDNLLTME